MKVAVVGSREFNDYFYLRDVLDGHRDKIDLLVSGGARGADTLAQKYAKENGIPILIYYPEWKKLGKQAGIIRNTLIADQADVMVAFAYKTSRGTRHAISYMRGLDKPVVVIDLEKENGKGKEEERT